MILERIIILISIVVSYFLQTSVDFFRLGEIKPDFILILTIYFALQRGSFAGLWVGFLGGLLQDINLGGIAAIQSDATSYYIGTHALPKTLIGYFVGKASREIHRDGIIVIFFVHLVAGILKGLVTFFEVAMFHSSVSAEAIATIVIPEAVYTAILSIFWFRILSWAIPQPELPSGMRKL
ncbi:MAG: rod shape-determining protein MreD [Leptospiraceae bacterium]|nr:rod shape-determining protein MreD [Leptospiraceae bacterium]